jgi:UDP-N-acetylmuramate--alanine ligase
VQNACAALLAAVLSDVPAEVACTALESYRGIPRRMEYKGSVNGAAIYDDYAHHPTELRAAITAAKKMTDGRVITLFQSHTYSRTRTFYSDFIASLRLSDLLFVGDVFAAREADGGEVSGRALARDAGGTYVPSHAAAAEELCTVARPGDLILLLGAGNMNTVADLLSAEK